MRLLSLKKTPVFFSCFTLKIFFSCFHAGFPVVATSPLEIPTKVREIGEENLKVIYKFLLDVNYSDIDTESTIDFGQPHLRGFFRPLYPLAITLTFYLLLILLGLVGNTLIVSVIRKKKVLSKDNTQLCMLNMALAFLAQLTFVIPFSLFVLVVHNWLLGYVMCFILPMAQVTIRYGLFSIAQRV